MSVVPKKILKKFQSIEEPNAIVVPKQDLAQTEIPLTISRTELSKLVKTDKPKRPRSEAQIAAAARLVEINKARKEYRLTEQGRLEAEKKAEEAARKKAEEQRLRDLEERERKLEEERAKLAAGTHVKLMVKPKKARTKKIVVQLPSDTDTTDQTDMTETETETDVEEYKGKARAVRRAAKMVKTIQKIDQVLQAPNVNPYLATLGARWR